MRKTFVRKMIELAEHDPEVMLLTGDLGFSVFEEFAARFPKNFINAGIAEQNMTGVAAGLAMEGHHVFVYSIGNFPTLRSLEQWRNDICYHRLPVTAVINGGGMAYGYLGMSHHATEDLSILRTLPEMAVTAPADPIEVEKCFDFLYQRSAPGYLRLCRGGERNIHSLSEEISPLELYNLCGDTSADTAIIMCGEIASMFDKLDSDLRSRGIIADIYSSPFVKPLPDLSTLLSGKYKLLVTVEENSIIGGFGGGIAEYLSSCSKHPPLLRIGIPDQHYFVTGNHDFLREYCGLSVGKIAEQVENKRRML